MRFALLTADYQPASVACGVGDYTRCLRGALEELGHRCLILTSQRTQSREPDVYRVRGAWDARDMLAAGRLLRSLRPDVVVMQYTPEHYGFGLPFKLLPLRLRWAAPAPSVITTFHTLVGGRRIAKMYAALLAAESHGLVSTHAELTDLFRRRLPWWAEKLREIPIGANIPGPGIDQAAARGVLRRRLGLASDTAVLGTFGFPAPGKGLDTLIQALPRLPDTPTAHLVCVGDTRDGDRSYRADLEALTGRLGLEARVHWLGGLPEQDVADTLAGADAYVVPYDEGSSLRRGTLMAGFRIGIPVVTTTPRYPDPSLRPGETMLAVPPRSPQALAGAIAGLLTDPAVRERLRDGMAAMAARFDWRTIAAQHVAFARELRGRNGMPA